MRFDWRSFNNTISKSRQVNAHHRPGAGHGHDREEKMTKLKGFHHRCLDHALKASSIQVSDAALYSFTHIQDTPEFITATEH